MSTLRVGSAGPLSGTTQNLMEGLAKAWANLNGTGSIALRDSFNISSTTDNGTGDYTFSFSNAMNNSDFSASGAASQLGTANERGMHPSAFATGSLRVRIGIGGGTATDADGVFTSVHGDLA